MVDEFRSYVLREISEIRDLVVKIKFGEVGMGSMQQSLDNIQQGLAGGAAGGNRCGRRVLLIF